MKKVLKYLGLGLVVGIIGVGGWLYYEFNLKTYDTEDEKVTAIIDSDFDIEIPSIIAQPDLSESEDSTTGNSTDSTSEKGNGNSPDSNDIVTNTNENGEGNKGDKDSDLNEKSQTNGVDSSGKSPNKPSAVQIKQVYRAVFENLEDQATDKLNNLLKLAYDEYLKKKHNGEKISYAYFYQKYKQAGENLEVNTNQAFEYLYSALQSDLEANGHSKEDATEFKEQFEQAKKKRENAILDRAKEILLR